MGRSRRQNRSRRQRQRQRGGQTGGDYKFTGTIAGFGAPAGAVVTSVNPHCQSGGGCGCMITAPQRGGDCMLPQVGGNYMKQYGGDCMKQYGGNYMLQYGGGNCMKQYGGSDGGYSVSVASNDLGKVGTIVPGSCQKGGEAPYGDYASMAGQPHVSALDMNTHAAGYSNGPAVLSPSAAFNLVKPYNANGGDHTIRTKKRKTRRLRQSRQSRR